MAASWAFCPGEIPCRARTAFKSAWTGFCAVICLSDKKRSRDIDLILEESHRVCLRLSRLFQVVFKKTQESSISPDVGPIQGGSQTHWECWPQQLPRAGGSPTAEELLLLMFGQLYIFCC